MRIIDGKPVLVEDSAPKVAPLPAKKKRRIYGTLWLILLMLSVLGGAYYYFVIHTTVKSLDTAPSEIRLKPTDSLSPTPSPRKKTVLRVFTGKEFQSLYENFSYPNTTKVTTAPTITTNPEADARIRTIAEARGYKYRAIPVSQISIKGTTSLNSPFLLQDKASVDWDALQKDANTAGFSLGVTSAFRSIDDQRTLFMEEINARAIDVNKIAAGTYDSQIEEILKVAAIPGYSRHHTGYTADFDCDKRGSFLFKASRCYDWVSKNNFENLKKHGWIPSYPDGTAIQGPNPEPWEFVWVGTDVLYE